MHQAVLIVIAALAGMGGVAVVLLLSRIRADRMAGQAESRLREERDREIEALIERIKGSFAILSQEALGRSAADFLKLASQTLSAQTKEADKELEGKKKLIEQNLSSLREEIERVRTSLHAAEKERVQQYGSLSRQISSAGEITSKLEQTTSQLATALASSRHRGQWGERMAEDVLRLAAFKEGIQYIKQAQVSGSAGRPDFTFFLPHDLIVNMDVKFPLDNYLKYLEAKTEHERERCKSQFLRDVQNRIKEVATREYINPEAHTVDYVIVFIPNEQVYAFVWENAPDLIDRGLEKKVLLCSPVTLLAILGVIRQAVENFNLERTTNIMLSLLDAFGKQWTKFSESMEKMGSKIDEAAEEYEHLVSTRRNMLDRTIRKIDELREQQGIDIAAPPPAGPPISVEAPPAA